jgi:hypothetical protein
MKSGMEWWLSIITNVPDEIRPLKESLANCDCCCEDGEDIFNASKSAEEGMLITQPMNCTIVYLKYSGVVKFEVFMVVTGLTTPFCHVTSCSLAEIC